MADFVVENRAEGARVARRTANAALLPVVIALSVAILVAIRANVYFMRPAAALLHPFDEAYATAFARRMLRGNFLPYVDAVSHRGPLFYVSVALAVRLFGNGTWMPVRALSLLCILGTIGLGFFAAWRAGRVLTGAVMALVVTGVLCVAMPLDDGLAYNSEHLLSMLAMASLAFLVLALRPGQAANRAGMAALSGLALSGSGLCKQTGFVLLLPFALWIASAVSASPDFSRRDRRLVPIAFALGTVLPVVALLLRYAAAGELSTLYYYVVTYNTRVYLHEFAIAGQNRLQTDALRTHFYVVLILVPVAAALLLRPFLDVRSLREAKNCYFEHGFQCTVGLAAILSPFVVDASLRDFDHYYVQVVPFAGFLLGAIVEAVLGEAGGRAVPRAAVLLPVAFLIDLGWEHRLKEFPTDANVKNAFSTHESPVCQFLRAHTKPDDSIFIWGFFPAPYTACNRRPASRYVYTTFVSGFVPHVVDNAVNDKRRVTPGAERIMAEELRREHPAVIIDAPWTLGFRSLTSDAFLRDFVARYYCEQKVNLKQPGMRAWVHVGRPGCPIAKD